MRTYSDSPWYMTFKAFLHPKIGDDDVCFVMIARRRKMGLSLIVNLTVIELGLKVGLISRLGKGELDRIRLLTRPASESVREGDRFSIRRLDVKWFSRKHHAAWEFGALDFSGKPRKWPNSTASGTT